MKTFAERPPVRSIVSAAEIEAGLRELGVRGGDLLLVHCSLSSFGHVAGGEQAMVEALRVVAGRFGTIVMPSQSWQLCDPDFLDDPTLDAAAREAMRSALPAYDTRLTPTRTMGRVAELFRTLPDAVRSPHPHRSFAAEGPAAESITARHELAEPFGEDSPLARLYAEEATVLLLGVGYESCTALHLAETRATHRAPRALVRNGAPMLSGGERRWVRWSEPVVEDDRFAEIGAAFEALSEVRTARIGDAMCRSMPLSRLVDFAAGALSDLQV